MVNEAITKLVTYALRTGLIEESEVIWATNRILEVLKLSDYTAPAQEWEEIDLPSVLSVLTGDAYRRGLIPEDSVVCRDLLDTALMGS